MWLKNEHSFLDENDYVAYYLYPLFLEIFFKENVILDLAAAKQIVDDRIKIQEGMDYLVLCHIDGVIYSDKPARDHLSSYGTHYLKAVAFVSSLDFSKNILDNYLINLNSDVPCAVFTTRERALEFLLSYSS